MARLTIQLSRMKPYSHTVRFSDRYKFVFKCSSSVVKEKVEKDEIQHLKTMNKNDPPPVQHSYRQANTESNQTLTRTEETPFI